MSNLRSQLAPGWSPVNIGLTIVLYLIGWPLALIMLAYIVWGRQMNLDFSQPGSFTSFTGRLTGAYRGLKQGWSNSADASNRSNVGSSHGGTPTGFTGTSSFDEEREALKRERDELNEERRKLDKERAEIR